MRPLRLLLVFSLLLVSCGGAETPSATSSSRDAEPGAPADTAPPATAPSEATPSETAPSETAPSETAPSETIQLEGRPGADAEARDVVLVTLDTLRFDALAFATEESGEWSTPVPNLERLAREGRSFTFALAHNTITLPSHANILTGRYPYRHGVRENAAFVLDDMPTAASLFAAEGFATGAFVSAYVLDSRFGLAGGFEVYDDRIERAFEPSAVRVWERSAPETVTAALTWWRDNAERRRFLWLHLFEPHLPYAPPEPFAADYSERPYRGEVAALDSFLGRLLDRVRGGERAPLVVVTADHGEALGDHGEPAHGIFAYQSTLHVPLILWGPGVEPGEDDRLARHVDLLPTLLAGAGAEAPPDLDGVSLLAPPVAGVNSYFECLSATFDSGWAPLRGVVEGRLKMIDLPVPELYDLAADPGETRNLVDERRRDFHRLRALLPEESAWPPPRGELTDEAAARLRSLGYLGDTSGEVATSFGVEDDPKRWIHVEQLKQDYAEHFRHGDFAAAVRSAREILEGSPEMPLAHQLLAEAQLAAGRRAEALETMHRARRRDLASPALVRTLASLLAEGGQAAEALAVITPLAEGGDAETRSLYGQILRENGRVREAEAVLRDVADRVPDDALTFERLSAVDLDLGRPREAEKHALRALELDETLTQAWNNLGVARVMTGRVAEGLEAWQRALELDPELYDTLYNLGFQAARAGRLELAEDALRRFIEGAPPGRYDADLAKARELLRRIERN